MRADEITVLRPSERGGQRRRRPREIVSPLGQPPSRATDRSRATLIAAELDGERPTAAAGSAHTHMSTPGVPPSSAASWRR